MRTLREVRKFASQKFRLTPGTRCGYVCNVTNAVETMRIETNNEQKDSVITCTGNAVGRRKQKQEDWKQDLFE